MLFTLLITLQVFYTIWFIKFGAHWFGPKFKFLDNPELKKNKKYRGFMRNDRKNWSKLEFYLTGIFLLPLRIFFTSFFIILSISSIRFIGFLMKIKDFSKPLPEKFLKMQSIILYIGLRSILYTLGFFYIKKKIIKFNAEKYPKLELKKKNKASIIVSNHITLVDIFYHLSHGNRCFISKASVKNYPFIGFMAQAMNSIFIDRKSKKNKQKILEILKKRAQILKTEKNQNDVVIFAEGTTSNGKSILNFKKGAFVLNSPIQIIGLKYEGTMNICFSCVGTLDCFLSTALNFSNWLTVFEIDGVVGPREEGLGWEEFAGETKRVFCEEFGFESVEGGFWDKEEMEEICWG